MFWSDDGKQNILWGWPMEDFKLWKFRLALYICHTINHHSTKSYKYLFSEIPPKYVSFAMSPDTISKRVSATRI